MFVFTKRYFESRLANDLIVDSTKIKEIRTWLLRRKLHFQAIVRIWFKELVKSRNDKKLAFMYLAYDVIWHSIKDCPEFVTEFGMYMEKVFNHLVTVDFDEKAINNIGEFIKIWRKRQIFDEEIQGAVEKIWTEGSVDDITVVKEIKKDKGCVDELPPHLTCSVCAGLLKEPVQLPCCKTALCKLCAFAKLEQHNACWFGFCPKSVVMRKDEVNLSPELAIQVDLWKTRNKERIKENRPVTDLEDKKNIGLLINASTKIEDIGANFNSLLKSACKDIPAKADDLDSKILYLVASEKISKSNNNNLSIVNDKANVDLDQIKNNEDFNLNGKNCNKDGIVPKREIGIKGEESGDREIIIKHEEWFHDDYLTQEHEKGFKGNDVSSYNENVEVHQKGHSCTNHWLCDKNSNAGCLLQWINPSGEEKEQCTVSLKDSPMRKAMKRRIHCDEEGSKKKSQMCEQNVDDNREALGIVRIADASNLKENTLVNPMITEWVKVCGDEIEEPINIATELDGTLLQSSITSQFPGTTGLKYRNPRTNCFHSVVRHKNAIFVAPKEGWTGIKFVCVRYNYKKYMKLTQNLVVHGLSPTTREEDVKKYFEKFGQLLTVRLIKPNCFAFIRFAQKAVELSVLSQTHMIDARWCFVAYSSSIEVDMCQETQEEHNREVFIDGVTEALTSEDLRKYFENFGLVRDVRFPKPRKSFAFVEFSDMKVAWSLRTTQHIIKGANVRVYQAAHSAQKTKQYAALKTKQYEDTHEAALKTKQCEDAHRAALKTKQYEDAHEAALKTKQCEVTQQKVVQKTKQEYNHCKIPGGPSGHKVHDGSLYHIILELPKEISGQDIRCHFQKFGKVLTVQLRKSLSGDFWGNAFIKFVEKEVVDKIIGHQLIGDQWCSTVRVTDSNAARTARKDDENERQIYVGQVTEDITAQNLKNHFETFGQVTSVRVPKPRRNFAFVQFSDRNVVASLLGRGDHVIKGVTVKIEKVITKGDGPMSARSRPRIN